MLVSKEYYCAYCLGELGTKAEQKEEKGPTWPWWSLVELLQNAAPATKTRPPLPLIIIDQTNPSSWAMHMCVSTSDAMCISTLPAQYSKPVRVSCCYMLSSRNISDDSHVTNPKSHHCQWYPPLLCAVYSDTHEHFLDPKKGVETWGSLRDTSYTSQTRVEQ